LRTDEAFLIVEIYHRQNANVTKIYHRQIANVAM